MYKRQEVTEQDIRRGCPICNLVQEMSGLDEGFKQRLSSLYQQKIDSICRAFERGKEKGFVKKDMDSEKIASFIVSSGNGIIGAGKCTGDENVFRSLIESLCDYIKSFRSV